MADQNPTTGQLVKAKAITADDVALLVKTYRANPRAGRLPLGASYELDVDKAISVRPLEARILNSPQSLDRFRNILVEMAILLARPEKA